MDKFILIPAYNPGNTLQLIVSEIRRNTDLFILIVDDGSNPQVKIDCENCVIIKNQQNMGKGVGLKNGFNWGIENNYKFAITIDADGQHSINHIMEFINTNDEFDFVFGFRSFSNDMPFHRRLSNFLTSKMVSIRVRKNIKDSQCGYRRYNLDKLNNYHFQEDRFMFETEVILKVVKKDTKIHHIEIPTIYADEISSIKNVSTTINFIKLFLRSFFF